MEGRKIRKKRINTRNKGRRSEIELKNMMEDAGWVVELVGPAKQYNDHVDFLGLYDLICWKDHYRKYIQVKCNRKPPFKKYVEWGEEFCNEYETVEVWVRLDNKRIQDRWMSYIVYGED